MIHLKLTTAQADALELAVEAAMDRATDTANYIASAELLNMIRSAQLNSTAKLTTNY